MKVKKIEMEDRLPLLKEWILKQPKSDKMIKLSNMVDEFEVEFNRNDGTPSYIISYEKES